MLNIENEYQAVRERAGWWERNDVGFVAICGEDRFTWLQGMVSNDTRLLASGETGRLPICVLDATGHLLSDGVLVAVPGEHLLAAAIGRSGQDFLLAELPRENVGSVMAHLDRLLIMEDVELVDVSASVGCITFQGPQVSELLCKEAWDSMVASCLVMLADHSSSGGMDLYGGAVAISAMRETLGVLDLPEIGTETANLLRVEAGIPRYGVDMDATVLAPEANLGSHISLTKGCYVGQEIVARIDARGHTNRALTGLILDGGTAAIPGAKLFFLSETEPPRETGRITSVALSSPAAGGQAIALGYVRHEHREPATRLAVGEEVSASATVTELPFYRKQGA